MAELNAAALIREDTFTIRVRFLSPSVRDEDYTPVTYDPDLLNISNLSPKEYIYICTFPVKLEEFVIVPARGVPTLAIVTKIDPDINIEPNANRKYGWVIARVDVSAFYENLQKNKQIEELLQKAYVTGARAQFRNAILANLPDADRARIGSMLKEV